MNTNMETTFIASTASLVRAYLQRTNDWRTINEIAQAIDRKRYQVLGELNNRVQRGDVIREFVGAKPQRYQRYRWKADA